LRPQVVQFIPEQGRGSGTFSASPEKGAWPLTHPEKKASGYRLQASGYRLQATGFRLQAIPARRDYRLQATAIVLVLVLVLVLGFSCFRVSRRFMLDCPGAPG
jgi:hypothetical protein